MGTFFYRRRRMGSAPIPVHWVARGKPLPVQEMASGIGTRVYRKQIYYLMIYIRGILFIIDETVLLILAMIRLTIGIFPVLSAPNNERIIILLPCKLNIYFGTILSFNSFSSLVVKFCRNYYQNR